jgi:hypothetical protein
VLLRKPMSQMRDMGHPVWRNKRTRASAETHVSETRHGAPGLVGGGADLRRRKPMSQNVSKNYEGTTEGLCILAHCF